MLAYRINICLLFLSVSMAGVSAERQNLFDWYYSAVFGTGSYRIGDRDVFVATAPYETQLRAASAEKYQIMLRTPVTVGFYDYKIKNIIDLEIPSDVATLTFFPGVYYVIPVSQRWSLKPFVNLGYGKEFEGGEGAVIYSAGVRTHYRWHENAWRVALGSSLYYAGNTRAATTDLGFAAFDAAIDINRATAWHIDGKTAYLGGYAAIYLFSNLEFIQTDQTTIEINTQYEFGLTLSTHDSINILGMDLERIGLGYLTSNGLRAWRLVFSFPY